MKPNQSQKYSDRYEHVATDRYDDAAEDDCNTGAWDGFRLGLLWLVCAPLETAVTAPEYEVVADVPEEWWFCCSAAGSADAYCSPLCDCEFSCSCTLEQTEYKLLRIFFWCESWDCNDVCIFEQTDNKLSTVLRTLATIAIRLSMSFRITAISEMSSICGICDTSLAQNTGILVHRPFSSTFSRTLMMSVCAL